MASTGFPPGLVLYQEHAISKPLKELSPLFPTTGSRHDILRSRVLLPRLDVQEDFSKSGCEYYGYHQFSNSISVRKLPLPADLQDVYGDSVLFSFGLDEQWTKRQEIWQFLMSISDELKDDNRFPTFVPDVRGIQPFPIDMYLEHATIPFKSNNIVEAKESFFEANGNSYSQSTVDDHVYNVPCMRNCVNIDGRLSLVGTERNMKDLASILAEFAVTKDSASWTKQRVLIPNFRWNDALDMQAVHPSSMMLGTVTSPLKSPEKYKRKSVSKRKTKKEVRERDLHRNNSLHAFETILSLMVDKKRNGKTMMNSLKKTGPEVPQLLTQISASIMGTGLAVMFSVLYKVACGCALFCTSNVLTSGVGVGLFSLSWAVNRLSDTIAYINKNFSKIGFEEEEMMTRVDKSVSSIVFRAAALTAVLMLRFA